MFLVCFENSDYLHIAPFNPHGDSLAPVLHYHTDQSWLVAGYPLVFHISFRFLLEGIRYGTIIKIWKDGEPQLLYEAILDDLQVQRENFNTSRKEYQLKKLRGRILAAIGTPCFSVLVSLIDSLACVICSISCLLPLSLFLPLPLPVLLFFAVFLVFH